MIDFIHEHLKEIVIIVPIGLLLSIIGIVGYLDMIYAEMVKEEQSEYPESSSFTQEQHAQALADDPNVESDEE